MSRRTFCLSADVRSRLLKEYQIVSVPFEIQNHRTEPVSRIAEFGFRLRFEIRVYYCHEKAEIPAEQTVRDFSYGNSGIRSSFLISFDKICCFYSKRQQAGG